MRSALKSRFLGSLLLFVLICLMVTQLQRYLPPSLPSFLCTLKQQLPQPLQLLRSRSELLDKAEDPPPLPILLTRIILFLRSTRNYYSRHTLYKQTGIRIRGNFLRYTPHKRSSPQSNYHRKQYNCHCSDTHLHRRKVSSSHYSCTRFGHHRVSSYRCPYTSLGHRKPDRFRY